MTATATAIFAPDSMLGTAAGSSTSRSARQREAPNVCRSLRSAGSTDSSPSMVVTATGKKVMIATMMIFGRRSKPKSATSTGAMTTTGMTCDAASSGRTARRRGGTRCTTMATATARTIAARSPRTSSSAVGRRLAHSSERSSHSDVATSLGAGNTIAS